MLHYVASANYNEFQWFSRRPGGSVQHERDMPMLELLAWLTFALAVYIAIVVTVTQANRP